MIALGFTVCALAVGFVLYLPFLLWFRFRRPKASGLVAPDLEASLHLAVVAARKSRYRTMSLEQLLLALLDNPRAVDVLRACAVDVEAMRADLSRLVRDSTPVAPGADPVEPVASPEYKRVLQRAITRVMVLGQSTGQRTNVPRRGSWVSAILRKSIDAPAVDGAGILVALLEEPAGAALDELHRRGVTRLAVTRVIAHGTEPSDTVGPHPLDADHVASAAIVLQNDDFTPMEFVVEMLQEHLGLAGESAVQLMLQVHREGHAVAGLFPKQIALEKAERVRAAATRAGHPFRCVVEAR